MDLDATVTTVTTAAVKLEGLRAGVGGGSVVAVTVDASTTAAAKAMGVGVKGVFDSASDSMLCSSGRRLG